METTIQKLKEELKSDLISTSPWILVFFISGFFLNNDNCSEKTIDKLSFSLSYHLIATVLIFIIFGVQYHASSNGLDISQNSVVSQTLKILKIIRGVNAWISVIGIGLSFREKCEDWFYIIIVAYLFFHIAYPLLKIIMSKPISISVEKKVQEKPAAEKKKKK